MQDSSDLEESYKGIDIYYHFVAGDKGFADFEFYTSSASPYSRRSIEEVKNDIDYINPRYEGEDYDF